MNISFGTIPAMKRASGRNTLGSRVKARRTALKLSQAKLGRAIGMTQTAIAEIEGGKVKRPGKLLEIAQTLRTDEAWLLHGDDVRSEDVAAGLGSPPGRTLCVMGYVGAGDDAHFYDVSSQYLGTVAALSTDPPNAAALHIMGDSLGPLFHNWYVIYSDVRSPVTDDQIGHPCVVWLADDRVLVKKIERDSDGFVLVSNSTEYPPIRGAKIKSAARVLDIRAKHSD